MALTLQDVLGAPDAPEELNAHLLDRGLIPPPVGPPSTIAPAPISAATGGAVAPMTPPSSARDRELMIGATSSPVQPMVKPTNLEAAPDISAAPGLGAALGGAAPIQPMTPPVNLSHAEKMGLPMTSGGVPDIGSAAYTRNELEKLAEEKAHPWGTAENHPGAIGKIGHVLGRVGNIAADVVAPGLALNIPGSDLNKLAEKSHLTRELATRTAAEGQAKNLASEEAARDVQTAEGRQRLLKQQNEQSLEKDAEGNVTGWKDATGKLHGLDEEGTPQGIKDIAEANQNKPHFEKSTNGDIVQITPGKKGEVAKSDVIWKGTPNQKTEIRPIVGADGHAHDQLIDVTPGSPTFGTSLKDLGRSKEDKQESPAAALAKEKAGEEPVIGYDKDGVAHIVPKSQATEMNLQHVIKASGKDREDAEQNTSVLNDMGKKVKNLFASRSALDQSAYERSLIATALSHDPDSVIRAGAIGLMSQKSKDYVQDVQSLREAALALPKQLTGGSRVSEIQAQALWQTIPAVGGDSKYGERQLRLFDENLDRLWKKVPRVEGNEPQRAFEGEEKGAGGAGATVKIGGEERKLDADGTFMQGGHRYKPIPGTKKAELVPGT